MTNDLRERGVSLDQIVRGMEDNDAGAGLTATLQRIEADWRAEVEAAGEEW